MKRILQAMDSVATKPVAGANDMAKFLSIVDKNATVQNLHEGKDPHKVALPVQMAMQHYQKQESAPVTERKPSLLNKFFHEVEQEQVEESTRKQQLINQYAGVIAKRVLMKENFDIPMSTHGAIKAPTVGPGMGNYVVDEAPIAMDSEDPNNPLIHSHEKANPATLKDRIMRTRAQLKELAELAESNDLLAWEQICAKAKGGMFMGLEQNLEQIRHGISELAKKRKQGGVASRGIDKNIGEDVLPAPKTIKPKKKTSVCRAGQVQTGMQTKNGKLVPKCSVK